MLINFALIKIEFQFNKKQTFLSVIHKYTVYRQTAITISYSLKFLDSLCSEMGERLSVIHTVVTVVMQTPFAFLG